MNLVNQNISFKEINDTELYDIDGGFFGPVLFTIWGTDILVGHALSAGVTLGIAALAIN